MEGELFADALFEREPPVLEGVAVRGVRWQELAATPCPFAELAGLGRPVKRGVIVQHELAGVKGWHQTVLDRGLKEGRGAVALKDEGGDERVLVKSVNKTDPLGAVARLLSPARLAPGTPAISQGFMLVDAPLSHIHQLLGGLLRQLDTEPLP